MAMTIANTAGNSTTTTAPVNAFPVYSASSGNYTVTNQLAGYNPKRYSGKILRKFYESCVLAQISNTDYEGEIKSYGDTVVIRTTPDITVESYEKGKDLTYRVYETSTVELTIDKGKYWAFVTNPIDLKQTDIKSFVEKWTSEAALRIKIAIEKDVFSYLITGLGVSSAGGGEIIDGYNKGANAGKVSQKSSTSGGTTTYSGGYNLGTSNSARYVSKDNVIDAIVDCGSVLAEQNIPVQSETCWMVVDQKFANTLALSDLKNAMMMGDGKSLILRGSQNNIPHLDCFDIYRSNVLPEAVGASRSYGVVLFGHQSALTFAAQLTENESLPNPNGFGTLHRGLTVYGFKVIQPKALGAMVVTYTAPASSDDE